VTQLRIYCDTNVFIGVIEGESNSPMRRALEALFVTESQTGNPNLTTSLLTVSELMVHPYKQNDAGLESAYRVFWQSNDYLEVGPADLDIMINAAQLRATYPGLKLPDAIHLATGLAFGCPVFLTGDQRLKGTYELRFRNAHPFFEGRNQGQGIITVEHLSVETVARLTGELEN
jgi:predicted nucleic acid-binding protein